MPLHRATSPRWASVASWQQFPAGSSFSGRCTASRSNFKVAGVVIGLVTFQRRTVSFQLAAFQRPVSCTAGSVSAVGVTATGVVDAAGLVVGGGMFIPDQMPTVVSNTVHLKNNYTVTQKEDTTFADNYATEFMGLGLNDPPPIFPPYAVTKKDNILALDELFFLRETKNLVKRVLPGEYTDVCRWEKAVGLS